MKKTKQTSTMNYTRMLLARTLIFQPFKAVPGPIISHEKPKMSIHYSYKGNKKSRKNDVSHAIAMLLFQIL